MDKRKVYFLMVLSTIFWAGAFIAGKISGAYIPPFTLTFLRFILATILMFIVMTRSKDGIYRLRKQDIPIFLFTGTIGMFGYHVLFFAALRYTTAINSSLIGASNPIITSILSMLILKDKISPKRMIGILLSFAGVFLTITNAKFSIIGAHSLNKGDLLMLLAVFMWASYSVLSKMVMQRYSPIILTFYSFLFCTVFLIPFVIYEKPWSFLPSVPLNALAAVLYMSVFPSVIGYLVQQMSIKEIGPSKTSIFINLVPIFSIILSVMILGEPLSLVKFCTALIIVAGVYICQRN